MIRHVFAVLAGLLLACLPLAGVALADGPWAGQWQITWRDGGALLTLEQTGETVTGSYPHPFFFTQPRTGTFDTGTEVVAFEDIVGFGEDVHNRW